MNINKPFINLFCKNNTNIDHLYQIENRRSWSFALSSGVLTCWHGGQNQSPSGIAMTGGFRHAACQPSSQESHKRIPKMPDYLGAETAVPQLWHARSSRSDLSSARGSEKRRKWCFEPEQRAWKREKVGEGYYYYLLEWAVRALLTGW